MANPLPKAKKIALEDVGNYPEYNHNLAYDRRCYDDTNKQGWDCDLEAGHSGVHVGYDDRYLHGKSEPSTVAPWRYWVRSL